MALIVVLAGAARDLAATRDRLERARASLDVLRGDAGRFVDGGRRRAARSEIRAARTELSAARRTLERSGFVSVVSIVPGVAYQRDGLSQLISDVDATAHAADRLLRAVEALERPGPPGEPAVPLPRVAAFEAEVRSAAKELRRVTRGPRGLWGPLAEARADFERETGPTGVRLETAADTIDAFRSFFGEAGPRRYFVAGLNNAEMRDQGMILSFAVVRFDGGRLTVERTDPIEAVELPRPVAVTLSPGTTEVFGGLLPTQQWRSINATADFPTSARTALAMYEAATRERLDGVIGLDVPALSELLAVTGPVTVPGFASIDADNVVPFLLSRQYDGLASAAPQRVRRDRVADVADVVARRLADGGVDRVELGDRLARAAGGRHVMVWSAAEAESQAFERAGLTGGLVPPGHDPETLTFHVSVQDATGTKVDYFVRPRVDVDVRVTAQGTATIRTRVTVRNDAPQGPASYALGPNNTSTSRPGQYVTRIYHWGPLQGSQPGSVEESGLRLVQQPLLVEPGSEGTVEFETIVPGVGDRLHLRFVPQPRHVPVPLAVQVRTAEGPLAPFSTELHELRTATWDLRR